MTMTFVPHPTGRPSLGALGAFRAVPARVTPTHVYRRRRMVAALVLATTIFCGTLVAGELAGWVNGVRGGAPAGAAGEPVVYVVQPGDTLWAIAERLTPAGIDVRHTVDRLTTAAGGALLQPGQRIELPVGG
ncbi:MAG: LysM peptidoglycan-binding domain-containing protein [Acidimicrobiales bacterium]|nr:LysM peptidoglycan-binding domain-containing protein [Acidimicrobiales bacterium]